MRCDFDYDAMRLPTLIQRQCSDLCDRYNAMHTKHDITVDRNRVITQLWFRKTRSV